MWLYGKKHGFGRFIMKDGAYHEGYYKAGLRHGEGKFIKSDGSEFSGKWDSHKLDGKTIF